MSETIIAQSGFVTSRKHSWNTILFLAVDQSQQEDNEEHLELLHVIT